METIGERVKRLREAKDMKAADVVKQTGLAQSYYSDIENGKRSNLTVETLKKLADCFGVTIDYLIGGKRVNLNTKPEMFPLDVADFIKKFPGDAWVFLKEEMELQDLSPESVAQIIQAVRVIKEKKGD